MPSRGRRQVVPRGRGAKFYAATLAICAPATATRRRRSPNTLPTVQRFLSGIGTYTPPAGVRYIRVRMVGGGGGGGAGEYVEFFVLNPTATAYVVGTGGAGGAAGTQAGGAGAAGKIVVEEFY